MPEFERETNTDKVTQQLDAEFNANQTELVRNSFKAVAHIKDLKEQIAISQTEIAILEDREGLEKQIQEEVEAYTESIESLLSTANNLYRAFHRDKA